MDNIHTQLRQLVAEACTYPPESVERRQRLNQIIRKIMRSGKLWRESSDYYNDALQETWEYCCEHLEEYDPERASVITWLDNHLKKRLRTWRDRKYRQLNRQISPSHTEPDFTDPIERIAAEPDIQPALEIWEETTEWVNNDPERVLSKTCFRNCPHINCQVLFLKRFPSETPWNDIASDFDLTPAETKDLPKFYNRKCLPLLREFGTSQGYIDPTQTPKKRKS
ncbi:sigma-70 family RNA polymerase sigma factor [Capilliphycus salinus ALCB114379]|uniref:sigma-70 family RNA polymerase sigma factor n=1 Tax=Capilliphycus salinus TaxID=2768948 RepID=UPI0039A689D5